MPQIDFNMFLPTAYWYSLAYLIFAFFFYMFYILPHLNLLKVMFVFQYQVLQSYFAVSKSVEATSGISSCISIFNPLFTGSTIFLIK